MASTRSEHPLRHRLMCGLALLPLTWLTACDRPREPEITPATVVMPTAAASASDGSAGLASTPSPATNPSPDGQVASASPSSTPSVTSTNPATVGNGAMAAPPQSAASTVELPGAGLPPRPSASVPTAGSVGPSPAPSAPSDNQPPSVSPGTTR